MTSSSRSAAPESVDLVPTRVRRHAVEQPDRQILAFLDEQVVVQQAWSFRELDRRARSIAAHVQHAGLGEQPVAIVYASDLEFVAAFIGCLYAGAVAVPACLPRAHSADERLSAILFDSGSRAVLTSSRYHAVITRHLAEAGLGIDVTATDTLPERSEQWSPRVWHPDALALLQYTSGSTRSPRGVMITHANLTANLESLRMAIRTHARSVGVSWLPLFHDMGLVAGVLEGLWVGYPSYLMAPATFIQNPIRWLRAMTRYGGTVAGGPNFAYQACVDAAGSVDVSELDLASWDVAWNGAEPVRASTLQQFCDTFAPAGFRRGSLTPSFGLAEATLIVSAKAGYAPALELIVDEPDLRSGRVRQCAVDNPRAKHIVSSGQPPAGTEIRIVHPETQREADRQAVGEIWVRSASVGRGYWQKPEESARTFDGRLDSGEGPFLRTGDLGFVHDGELFVTGRLKDVIVIRGVNYYPHDIERTVESSHPALRPDACALVGIEEAGRVQLVVIQEVRRQGWRTLDPSAIFDGIRRAVARDHQLALHGIVLLKPYSLPKTSSGKVQRAYCRAAVQDRSLPALHEWWAPAAQVAPIDFTGEPLTQPGVIERQLVDWLQRELSLTNLTWQTPLIELGIDSLKGVELGNALSAAFNHTFPATLIIDHPTIEALARLIREEVLGVKPVPPPARRLANSDAELAEEIGSLDEDELDAVLRKSIDDVLRSGGRA